MVHGHSGAVWIAYFGNALDPLELDGILAARQIRTIVGRLSVVLYFDTVVDLLAENTANTD